MNARTLFSATAALAVVATLVILVLTANGPDRALGQVVTPTPTATATLTATPTAVTTPTAITFTNTTPQAASDLHIIVDQNTATHNFQLVTNAPGCSQPTITVNRVQDVDFEFVDDVVWSSACVDPGESASFSINCGTGCNITRLCYNWTIFASPIGTQCLPARTTTPSATASPTVSPTPLTPTPTATATSTASPTPSAPATTPTPTPTPVGTPTATATPGGPTPQPQDIYTVNSTGDGVDAARGDGRCETATPGECTLRAAIEDSNTLRRFTPDVIMFNIGGGGLQTISPQTPLPSFEDRVIIDGTTQPGYSGSPLIQVAGGGASAGANGLRFTNGGSTVKGLDIRLFGGDGIRLETFASGTVVTQSDILGNAGDGIEIAGGNAVVTKSNIMNNAGHGVNIASLSNKIGDAAVAGSLNRIQSNGGDGVFVASGAGNRVLSLINVNSGLGIDLAPDGPTANDPGDGDGGANNLQNFPVITSAVRPQFSFDVIVSGTINSRPNTTYAIDIYFTDPFVQCPGGSFTAAQNYGGSTTATTNGNGDANWSKTLTFFDNSLRAFVATATDPFGNTSEFSNCVGVQFQTPSPTPTATACAGCTPTATPTPTPIPTPTPTLSPAPAGHDARLVRISNVPKSVRLLPGEIVGDSGNVVIANQSTHSDTIGVYVDVMAPSAGGCTPDGRVLQTTITLAAGAKTTLAVPVSYSCADPAAANGLSYTWVAVADHGGDDLASCGPGALQSLACFNALADDDQDPSDNRLSRNGPKVVAQ